MPFRVTESTAWRAWVTPKVAKSQPIHRWYLLPHSFTGDLVHALIDEWHPDETDNLLDPFAGAGTTLLAAKERGTPGSGYDLSPLAVLASNTKTTGFCRGTLQSAWITLLSTLNRNTRPSASRAYPEFGEESASEWQARRVRRHRSTDRKGRLRTGERDFFKLALISLIPRFSYAVANGGWLRWLPRSAGTEPVVDTFKARVEMMLADVRDHPDRRAGWEVRLGDARSLPDGDDAYTAVITSPPYPNRHDYTRVFGVELMFDFLDWKRLRELRYQSFHSHPEAHPQRPSADDYEPPDGLEESIRDIQDKRIRRMLRGYFLDMYLCLRELSRVCRDRANVAVVVGNARYSGRVIRVDEYTAELGERVGLICREICAVRWRGNSARQMGRYGRVASRESVVLFNCR